MHVSGGMIRWHTCHIQARQHGVAASGMNWDQHHARAVVLPVPVRCQENLPLHRTRGISTVL